MKSKRNYTLEFWRFVFALLICLFHFERKYIIPEGADFFFYFASGFMGVEFFFILAGFFIARSREKVNGDLSIDAAAHEGLTFVKKKFTDIFPRFITVIPFFIIFVQGQSFSDILKRFMNLEWDLLFLQNTGVGRGGDTLAVMWFISTLVIVGYFTVVIFYWKKSLTKYILVPIAWLLGYSYFGFRSDNLSRHIQQYGALAAGTIRGFAGLALGITAYQVYLKLCTLKLTRWKIAGLNLLELYTIFRVVYLTVGQPVNYGNFRVLVYFPILIILSYANITVLSKLLNNKVSKILGKLTMSIFLIHPGLVTLYHKYILDSMGRKWDMPLFMSAVFLLTIVMEVGFAYIPLLCKKMKKSKSFE